MMTTRVLHSGSISVLDFRGRAGPDDAPFVERHEGFTLSYVRRGSFGYRTRGASFELVAGSILVGHAGDEFTCTHEHHAQGDECLSFHLTPELVDTIGASVRGSEKIWRTGGVPPLPELMVWGELAQAAAEDRSDVGLDEVGLLFASRFVEIVSGRKSEPPVARPRDRRRAVAAALRLDEDSHEPLDLESVADEASLSP